MVVTDNYFNLHYFNGNNVAAFRKMTYHILSLVTLHIERLNITILNVIFYNVNSHSRCGYYLPSEKLILHCILSNFFTMNYDFISSN